MDKAYLILQSGDVYEGTSIGAKGEAIGEVVFTTGMGGYIETLTDPSYYGLLVTQTFPSIGNYGVMEEDFESDGFALNGYIVREICDKPSNFRAQGKLDDLLKKRGVVGIADIDTRRLTKTVRECGVMNGIITPNPTLTPAQKDALNNYKIKDAVRAVTTDKIFTDKPADARYRVALMDYGAKRSIVRELTSRGCEVVHFPCSTPAEKVMEYKPDGILLSSGPSDPEDNAFETQQIAKLFATGTPMMGICLGHLLLAAALGAETHKLKYGHRGENQPVKDVQGGRVYITSQNHGYVVDGDSLPSSVGKTSFVNVNDGTCEGIDYAGGKTFSVQFHPEACGGPLDTVFLFDRFINNMEDNKKCR